MEAIHQGESEEGICCILLLLRSNRKVVGLLTKSVCVVGRSKPLVKGCIELFHKWFEVKGKSRWCSLLSVSSS